MERAKKFSNYQYRFFKLLASLVLFALVMLTPIVSAKFDSSIKVNSQQQVLDIAGGNLSLNKNIRIALAGTEITGSQANIMMDGDNKPAQALFTNGAKLIRKEGSLKQIVQAKTLNMGLQSGDLKAEGKVVTKIEGDQKLGQVSIHSDSQIFDQEKRIMKAIGNVEVQKGEMKAISPEAIVFMGHSGSVEKVVFIKGAKLSQQEQEIKAETITVKLDTGDIFAEKNSESKVITRDKDGKTTVVKIKSHLQELDHETGTLLANGNTVVHYEDYLARGPKAVFYRANEQLDRIVLSGRAEIEDTDRKVAGDTVTITFNPKRFNAHGNVNTFIKAKKQHAISPLSKNAKTETVALEKNVPEIKTDSFDEELMLEKIRQESEKQQ